MRHALVLAGLGSFALASPSTLAAQTPVQVPVPVMAGISVSAAGEEQIVPDRARLSVGVQTQAPTAAAASQRNARIQQAVFDTLRALGLPADQLTTSGYNVYPEQVYDQPTRRTRITAYNVQNTIVVELKRIDQVGPALDAVLAKGANNVSSLQFYSSQAEAARRRALARAVENARADADALARAAGGSLGELLELASGIEMQRPRPIMMSMTARAASQESADTPISEGTQTVSASVTARWRFVQGPGR